MKSVSDVIDRMRQIGRELPPEDGVACFTRLYLSTTENIAAAIQGGRFEDGDFLAHLDVIFAGLFFAAYDDALAGKAPPRAWEPLFSLRAAPKVLPIQFALSGMNAHINRDLSVALVLLQEERDMGLVQGSAQHRDFLLVNRILEETEIQAKLELSRGLVHTVDEALGHADDVMALWSAAKARDAAWTHAQALRALSGTPALRDAYLLTLDRMVGFAGRALLQPRFSR